MQGYSHLQCLKQCEFCLSGHVPFPRTAKEVGPSLVVKVTEVNLLHGPWYEFLSYMRTKAAMSRWPWYAILNCKRIEDAAVRNKIRIFLVHRKW